MVKIIFTLLLFIGLSSCVTNDNLSSIPDKVSNLSDKVVSLVNSDKEKKSKQKENIKPKE